MTRIAIIGGGIGGLTTAIALKQVGFEADVFEQAPQLLDVGAAIALWPNAMRVMERLELSEKIMARAGLIHEIQWMDQHGRAINKVSLKEGKASNNTPSVALHRADLQEVLLEAVPSESVHLGSSLIDLKRSNETVVSHFANGHHFESDLLIGADGIHSRIRSLLLDDSLPVYRGYAVWRGICTSVTKLIPPTTAIEIVGSGKRFGLGPVGLGKTGWWAAVNAANTSTRARESKGRLTWKKGEPVDTHLTHDNQRELLRLFDGWHRPVLQLIEATPSASILKTGAFDRPISKRWGLGRVTLLGDAIHPTTPNLGQGGCMAIEDALLLATCLEQIGPNEKALRAFERSRQKRTSTVTRYSRIYGEIGQWKSVWARGLRRTLMSLVPENVARRVMETVFDFDVNDAFMRASNRLS